LPLYLFTKLLDREAKLTAVTVVYVTFRVCMSRSRQGAAWERRIKESTWSICCELLSELVSLLQLVKPPLIYVLRGHDSDYQACIRQ